MMETKRKDIGSERPLWQNSLHKSIIQILEQEGRPMRVNEITKKILEKRRIASNTPQNTISAILQSSAYVKRVERGVYKLIKSSQI
jgi:hypothetical protein